MTFRSRYSAVPSFITKDGSEIRELMHPARHAVHKQSLAEAIVQPGQKTTLHRHDTSEEIYHITRGYGLMTLGDKAFEVATGDTVCIAPGTAHCIENLDDGPLRILCACSPAYSDADTQLLE
jgi:mannose-6-phosphate isomerase-like protein (cupin superfamily)